MLPNLLNAYSTYREVTGALSPSQALVESIRPASEAREGVQGRGSEARQRWQVEEEEQALLAEIGKLNLRTLAPGIVSLEITEEQLLDLVEARVKANFAGEGAEECAASITSPSESTLVLPGRTVLMRIALELTPIEEERVKNEAERNNPAEMWLFSLAERDENTRLPPKFLREDKVAFGYLRLVPISRLLQESFGRFYDVIAVGKGKGGLTVALQEK